MKSKFIVILLLFLMINLEGTTRVSADNIKIQRAFDTGIFSTCIAQDKDGLLWISAAGPGLFCYDGNEF